MEGFEGAIGADWALGAEGAMGAEGAEWAEGVEGAEEDEWAAIYILLDGYDIMGIGYMALWGFAAKCRMEWMEWMEWSGYALDCYDY